MSKLYLIDGNAYIHRAYHALPPLTTSKGEMVNAVYGFFRMITKIVRQERPDYVAVCFDAPALTFRHREYAAYKANRKQIDDELKTQMPLARDAAKVMGLPSLEKPGYEADDIIATLAREAAAAGTEVVIVSSDKDALQLVGDRITVFNEAKNVRYDREAVREKYGLYPEQLIDMFALMGDASDNVPGIRGVGEKTAVKLLLKFGSLDNLLARAGELEGRVKELVSSGKADAEKSKFLVTLDDRVPLERSWQELKQAPPDEKTVTEFLCRMEFNSLLKELLPSPEPGPCVPGGAEGGKRECAARTVLTPEALESLTTAIGQAGRLSFDLETTSLDPEAAKIVGVSLAMVPDESFYIPVGHSSLDAPKQLPEKEVLGKLAPYLADPKLPKYGHNIKYDYRVMRNHGIELNGIRFDTMVASYCLNPSRNSHGLKVLALDFLGYRMTEIEELIGKGAKQITMDMVPVEKAAAYACDDAVVVLWLAERFDRELKERKLEKLFADIEMPLVPVLAEMERQGLQVDVPYLEGLSKEFEGMLRQREKEIYALAGQEFNPNSPKQLAVVLFEKLGLPVIKKTKTGASTDEEVLRTLAPQHDLPAKLIEYRELQKLKSTYIDALLELRDPKTGRVHTSFNQAVTATGRLSSSEPNLQNIPVRTEYGRKIRRSFIAAPGNILVSADYSQIDLRALAHLSGDEALLGAFRRGEDIHSATAREVFDLGTGAVTPEQRRIAKTINFGIVYGMSAFSLAQQLGIENAKAKEYIDGYFARYHGVKRWMEKTVKDAHSQGYVTTLTGRIRYLPDINSSAVQMRNFAERTAMNTPVQGTSADIIKVAMIAIDEALRSRRLRTKMLVQVHDELLFDVPEDEAGAVIPLVRDLMENAMKLDVPLVVDVKTGANWNDMKGVPRETTKS